MQVLIRVRESGDIASILKTTDDEQVSLHHPVKLEKVDALKLLESPDPRQLYYDGTSIVSKPVASLSVDVESIEDDGVDMATVTISGVPESYDTVQMSVGGQLVDVDPDEPIEITSTIEGVVMVRMKEEMIWCPDKIRVIVENEV